VQASVKLLSPPMDVANTFQIITPQKTFILSTERAEEVWDWINVIRAGIQNKLILNSKTTEEKAVHKHEEPVIKDVLALLNLPENQSCADCGAKDIRWADVNFGVFLCPECSGIHRRIGHICKVKALNFGKWEPPSIEIMIKEGNARANQKLESRIGSHLKKPTPQDNHTIKNAWVIEKYKSPLYPSTVKPDPAPVKNASDTLILKALDRVRSTKEKSKKKSKKSQTS